MCARRANRLARCLLGCCEHLSRLEETFTPASLFSYGAPQVTYRSALLGLLADLTRAYAAALPLASSPATSSSPLFSSRIPHPIDAMCI